MADGKIPFLDIFPDAAVYGGSCGGLENAEVLGVVILRETLTMDIRAHFQQMPAPVELSQLERLIAERYGLQGQ